MIHPEGPPFLFPVLVLISDLRDGDLTLASPREFLAGRGLGRALLGATRVLHEPKQSERLPR